MNDGGTDNCAGTGFGGWLFQAVCCGAVDPKGNEPPDGAPKVGALNMLLLPPFGKVPNVPQPDGFLTPESSTPMPGPVRLPSDVPTDEVVELPPNANPVVVVAAPNVKTFCLSADGCWPKTFCDAAPTAG